MKKFSFYGSNNNYTVHCTVCVVYCQSLCMVLIEPAHDKTNKMACAPSEDSYQPGHPPMIRLCSPREESLGAQQRL